MDSDLFLFSHKFILLILLIVVVLIGSSLLVPVFYRPAEFEQARIKLFFSSLASIAVFLVGLNLVLTSLTFEFDRLYTKISIVKQLTDRLWLEPNRLFAESKHARPEFLASFSYNNVVLYKIALQKKSNAPLTEKTILEEQNIASFLLQAWEDFFNSRAFDERGTRAWISCFLVWAQSPYLKKYFDISKQSYDATTIRLGNILFEYAAKLPIPNPDVSLYDKGAVKIMQDPRFIQLLREAPH